MESILQVNRTGSVGYLVLNRPESLNALNIEMALELAGLLEEFESDDGVRAVLLTGKGQAFCSGGDLRAMQRGAGPSAYLRELIFHLNRAILSLRRMPKPVLAAVNGPAAGAGMSLALACDLRIAGRSARFRQAYTSNGLVPDGGWSIWCTSMLGLGKASELVFQDRAIDARQALAMGLVNEVVDDGDLEERSRSEAERLAGGATFAYGQAKTLLNQSLLPSLATILEQERQAMISAGAGHDGQEGIKAFLEKRQPEYTGR